MAIPSVMESFFLSNSDLEESSDEEFLSESEDEEEDDVLVFEDRKRPKNDGYEEVVDQFNEIEFIEHFRIKERTAVDLATRFERSDYYRIHSGMNGRLSPYKQVLIYLWFSGHQTASFRDVADRFGITISSLFRVSRRLIFFVSSLSSDVIKWPNDQEQIEIETYFRAKGFPGVIGAIDGSHIKIDKPSNDPDSYYNRKNIIQYRCKWSATTIRRLGAYLSGSQDRSMTLVFRRSPLYEQLNNNCGRFFILGDSAYPCSRHLVTPYKDVGNLTRNKKQFNQQLSKCRIAVEHCFGLLKQKFRQFYHCKLRKVTGVVHFIRACCVLHNLAHDDEFPAEISEEENTTDHGPDIGGEEGGSDAPEGLAFRDYLLATMFPANNPES